ncbi:WecB/TagA/CpsF family glycosyltransferase [Dactylosporangium sp. NPDC048998]|uniref:WecB/TagA/CpsF family glycosyltransferase n=1 Tax=Dactylosporangium sp. NPDC048998 TaxID=3363976 RepID=UPI0037121AD5
MPSSAPRTWSSPTAPRWSGPPAWPAARCRPASRLGPDLVPVAGPGSAGRQRLRPRRHPAGEPDGAHRAAARLAAACPGLRIAGAHCPPFGFDRRTRALRTICARVIKAKPQMVYVGIGFPRQEHLIVSLRAELPSTWFLGCGVA